MTGSGRDGLAFPDGPGNGEVSGASVCTTGRCWTGGGIALLGGGAADVTTGAVTSNSLILVSVGIDGGCSIWTSFTAAEVLEELSGRVGATKSNGLGEAAGELNRAVSWLGCFSLAPIVGAGRDVVGGDDFSLREGFSVVTIFFLGSDNTSGFVEFEAPSRAETPAGIVGRSK